MPAALAQSLGGSRLKLTADLSLLSLITGASLIVQLVLALLLFPVAWSWWQIFQKMFVLKRTFKETVAFEDEFWNGADLNALL
jgi:biopolymer transport protein TolQ